MVGSNGIAVEIGKSAGSWLTVGKANGEALSDKEALVETASVGGQSLADWQKAIFV
jgi:hypothetical protein